MNLDRYPASGFIPITEPPARRKSTAAAFAIKKGDALFWAAGLLTNQVITFSAAFAGVAAADCDASGEVEYYPADELTQYKVRCAADTVLVAITHKGTNCDLSACGTIAVNDDPTEGWAFQIDDIDISADALAAHSDAYGFAIGHFRVIGTQAGNS